LHKMRCFAYILDDFVCTLCCENMSYSHI
jgi:hypothetical protein